VTAALSTAQTASEVVDVLLDRGLPVLQATRGRWSDTSDRAGTGDAVEARWWRDDWPQATLRIEADGVRWIEHNGRIHYAPLDAATLLRLRNL